MTTTEAFEKLQLSLQKIYSKEESVIISRWTIEAVTGLEKNKWTVSQNNELDEQQESKLQWLSTELLHHKPIQYVLKEAWFCGLKLYVDENVLIPRPETEELVEWVVSEAKKTKEEINIADIGTGSGCIALALKNKLWNAKVSGYDISDKALETARRNVKSLDIDISLHQIDFLDQHQISNLPIFDIIVSNPPYVPQSDRSSMAKHVVEHEPATALFVPNHDPLIFYRAIADFGKEHLSRQGMIFIEIHENLGSQVIELLRSAGYSTILKKDMQGKDRMIMLTRS